MALDVWNKPSGYSFGIFQERTTLNIPLPVGNYTNVTYNVISGNLPTGLRIVNNAIIGAALEVLHETTYSFCIRASTPTEIADRTFNITIQGEDAPLFVTPVGFLQVGTGTYKQYFAIDNSIIDYQLSAVDTDTIAGAKLSYFISSKDGQLPPGLTLSTDGRIFGRVQAVTEIRLDDGDGTYDTGLYGVSPYDYAFYNYTNNYATQISNGGYEFYPYDVIYDYIPDVLPLRSLNRNYEFVVTVSNGVSLYDRRAFQIYVVGDTCFRTDSTELISDTGLFTTDVTYLRNPAWLTSKDLGSHRANNYITLFLDVYDLGEIFYRFETTTTIWKPNHYYYVDDLIYINSLLSYICTVNHRSGISIALDNWHAYGLPPGMKFDQKTSEIFGYVPYQAVSSKIYKFIVTAYRYGDTVSDIASSSRTFSVNIISEINTVLTWDTDSNLGTLAAGYNSTLSVHATSTASASPLIYRKTDGMLPPGLKLLATGEISGNINHYATVLSFDNDDLTFDHNRTSFRQNTVDQYGLISFDFKPTVETTFRDIVPVLDSNGNTTSFVELSTTFNGNGVVTFNKYKSIDVGTITFDYCAYPYNSETNTFIDNPYETSFNIDKVTFRDLLINVLDKDTTFDDDTTTIDHKFTFNVRAADQYVYSAIDQTFTIDVSTPNSLSYNNIYVKPFLTLEQRAVWSSFINDPTIFTLANIYRPSDLNFGVQTNLEMLIYAGIEDKQTWLYAESFTKNFKKKQFRFDGVHKAIAMPIGTSTPTYEIVYITMIDPLEIGKSHLSNQISINNTQYYPSSTSIWQDHIRDVGSTKGNLLPLWMRSIQPGTRSELGFVLAIPLCYCKVGKADDIILNIKYSNFDFKLINYTVDRLIIDAATNDNSDKYIIFNNNRETI